MRTLFRHGAAAVPLCALALLLSESVRAQAPAADEDDLEIPAAPAAPPAGAAPRPAPPPPAAPSPPPPAPPAEGEDDLAEKLAALAILLPPDIPLVGASLGGESLPSLRAALIAADRQAGGVSPRLHPRLEPGAFAELLQRAGFARPAVDVDRVKVRYSSLDRLVGDLRALGAGNALAERSRRYPGKAWRAQLTREFPPGSFEQFDILHFSAWTGTR